MTHKRSIIFFWALFLVPTLIMAGAAFTLLSHEQDRISESARTALVERARTVCESIHLTIETVQGNLVQSLLDLDPQQLEKHLIQWEQTNPLIRNVFIWQKKQNEPYLEYPLRGMASTREERWFIARYDALFTGRIPFDFNREELNTEHLNKESENKPLSGSGSAHAQYDADQKMPGKSSRQTLFSMSRLTSKSASDETAFRKSGANPPGRVEQSGWIPWFSENRLFILGWVQKYETGPVYGVELEFMTLLSQLVTDFPTELQKNSAMVLMDGYDTHMHQAGQLQIDPEQKPLALIPVSPRLPHWRLGVFTDTHAGPANRGFLYISLLLLGVFISAIVSGGILLTRATLANMKDAQQKTSFVSSVSHELKTPLTSIRMYAELLLSKRVQDETRIRTYLSVIVDESHRLTRLINNVLDFGRLEQGKKKYQYSVIDLADFLDHIVQAHSIRIHSSGMQIFKKYRKLDYTIRTDRDALEQVVLNLLDNALKYAAQGKFILFILEKENDFFVLKICDDGPGISRIHREKIFERFHRVDDSLSAKQPGSGLGLTIARQILRDLGGDLNVEPMPGNGSCFTARIKHHDAD
ncbi:MAG: HAMP domain-containing histidine kinase [Proteobacteria bacterium]|nr:HAMP domain-containing histidine kinase [Pseudomonadota bacterium]MBU1388461.1 HAMP domain-containing histidine kinase [Pseudomonadota bacterium]MBU1542715.1 HAMP domain-containing histidine kinase [Pseudomonadota bacterium]MBU2430042.1 HAMP domain-containing histidine kinase [Pseudomonadota bacterium]MBU2481249.1 HAMP domain-containing histidine kinase [Pseudomonadota bacterium]